jgi:hypothetical protein
MVCWFLLRIITGKEVFAVKTHVCTAPGIIETFRKSYDIIEINLILVVTHITNYMVFRRDLYKYNNIIPKIKNKNMTNTIKPYSKLLPFAESIIRYVRKRNNSDIVKLSLRINDWAMEY